MQQLQRLYDTERQSCCRASRQDGVYGCTSAKYYGSLFASYNSLQPAACPLVGRYIGLHDSSAQVSKSSKVTTLVSSSILQVAFTKTSSVAEAGRLHGISTETVKRCKLLTSAALLARQQFALDMLRPALSECHGGVLTYCVNSIAFDETQHELQLKLRADLAVHQQCSAWHVLVSSCDTVCGSTERRHFQRMVRPPAALVSTRAPQLMHGLFCVPFAEQFETEWTKLSATVSLPIRNFSTDHAHANDKLLAHVTRVLFPTVPTSHRLCSLHQTKHIESALVLVHGSRLVSRMYSTSLMYRTCGYFVRILSSSDQFVENTLEMRRGVPPSNYGTYAAELFKFLRSRPTGADVASPDSKASSRRKRPQRRHLRRARLSTKYKCSLAADWDCLVRYLNSDWNRDIGKLVHYCKDAQCCIGADGSGYCRNVAVAKIQLAIRRTILRVLPSVPVSIKWNRLDPSCHWQLGALGPHRCFQFIYENAFGKLVHKVNLAGEAQERKWKEDQIDVAQVAVSSSAFTDHPPLRKFEIASESIESSFEW